MTTIPPQQVILPPGGLPRRSLHIIVIVQNATGMSGPLIAEINSGLDRLLRELGYWETSQAATTVLVRAITSAGEARWHIAGETSVFGLRWPPVSAAEGPDDTASAFRLAASGLGEDHVAPGDFRPVLMLISAGLPSADPWQVDEALEFLDAVTARRGTVRMAIAVGGRDQRRFLARFLTLSYYRDRLFTAAGTADVGDAIAEAGQLIGALYQDTRPAPPAPTEPAGAAARPSAPVLPGGFIARRPLHLLVLVQSNWQAGAFLDEINFGLRGLLATLADWDQTRTIPSLLVRAVAFGREARLHIADPTPVSQVRWPALEPLAGADQGNSVAGALRLAASLLGADRLEQRAMTPNLLLVLAGSPTDSDEELRDAVALLDSVAGGRGTVNVAVGIGAGAQERFLAAFASSAEWPDKVLTAPAAEAVPAALFAASQLIMQVNTPRS